MKLPYASKRGRNEPLSRCITRTADRMVSSPHLIAVAIAYFFEELAGAVARGSCVTIPGIGLFATAMIRTRAEPNGRAIPKFSPARALRHEVANTLPPDRATTQSLARHRKRNHVGAVPGRVGQRPFTALGRFRQLVQNDAGGEVED